MATKLLHTLADDNADLQKQIGCMNGILQIFDRHHFLTGRRTTNKRITSGNAYGNSINFEKDPIDAFNQQRSSFQDLSLSHSMNEKQRLSTESSRPSFSSSCSSSLSSSEFNKGAQPEALAFDSIIFPATPSRDPIMSEGSGLHSLDLRDVVRGSMYREARDLSVKAPMAREEVGRRSRREDSPRPVDLNDTFKVLAKLREAPRHYNELIGTKDAPRYSVDSLENLRSRQKLKELPRLSLDSGECELSEGSVKRPPSVVAKLMGLEAMPGSPLARDRHQFSPRKTGLFEDNIDPSLREKILNHPIRNSTGSTRNLLKDQSSPRWRNADFVMKSLPSSRFPLEPAPWRQLERNKPLQKQAVKPAKPSPPREQNSNSNSNPSSPSVYSEMEKRLKDLEFKHSGKDLRTLKQILEAMHSKGFLETRKQARSPNIAAQRDWDERVNSSVSGQGSRNHAKSSSVRGVSSSSSAEVFGSPIVIMKPAKLVEKAGIPASSLIPIHSLSGLSKIRKEGTDDDKRVSMTDNRAEKHRSPGTRKSETCISRNVRSSSANPQQISRENVSKSSGSISPRLQQKKLEFEKCSRPPTPPSDSSRPRRQSTRQPGESTSPGGRRRPKAHNISQKNDDQQSQVSNESRTSSSHLGDGICTQSKTEVVGVGEGVESCKWKVPSAIEAVETVISNLMQNKSCPRSAEDSSSENVSVVALQHPSPSSVHNVSVCYVASSPVKTEDNKGISPNDSVDEHCEDQWNPAFSFSENTSGFSPEINRKKLQNVEHLVQKLRRLNSNHDEASKDYIASLCDNTNPNTDHKYISEILLASGLLLRDLGSGLTAFQLHPSGHPINPELFLVLEQTKGSGKTKALNNEKLHRKLVFDTVNEILVEKLVSVEEITDQWMKSVKMVKRALSGQQLLKDLCYEIEVLQKQAKKRLENFVLGEEDDFLKGILAQDVIIRSGNWTDFENEIPGLVLDVERLLFKDLVDDVVHGEAGGRFRQKTGRRRTILAHQ